MVLDFAESLDGGLDPWVAGKVREGDRGATRAAYVSFVGGEPSPCL